MEMRAARQGERIKILRARLADATGTPGTVIGLTEGISVACARGAIQILEVQRPGKRPMPTDDFLRGFPLRLGAQL